MISWAFTYPQDVIKSKIQADNLGRNSTYKGYIHCYKMTVAQHGYGILTRGMASSLIRYVLEIDRIQTRAKLFAN